MKDAACLTTVTLDFFSVLNIRRGVKVMDGEGDPVGSDLSFITHRVWFI